MNETLPRVDVVMTTIGDGEAFLSAYRTLLGAADAHQRVRIVVIPDRKTPAALFGNVERARRDGLHVVCPTVAEQDALLADLGAPTLVPYDSDNRRNVGYLLSWQSDADFLVSVDDDNFPIDGDFLTAHAIVAAGPRPARVVTAASGWWNPCGQLTVAPMPVYPRGFPYAHRNPTPTSERTETVDVRINAGLWLGDPDVDAITRIAVRPEVTDMPAPALVCDTDTWAPVNSQNTAVHRDAIPAYYFPRMGYRHHGQEIDRYADIFSGYFVQACAKRLGHAVRFGDPLARHTRNEHLLLRDLQQELTAIAVLEDVLGWLHDAKLDGDTYAEAYVSLSYQLQDAVEAMTGRVWTHELRGFVHQMAHLMRQWVGVLRRCHGGPSA
ncbi:hypothetical protein [Micromonospora carbonacea]|uniref:Reversibly glycosylated polypeptide n=1 Tax=Micromonospora carbonacea TaxID=47853 RepID=A0A7H8XN60_9ACTN|nr:hypothetical protein [Micromonospora carbonacea]MBB5827094.1 hypothetical protein [Micromonospora carbonacea]QLD25091.1 hypothetical protein HXZ27_13455 [Micromonospora carbonacea]